MGKESALAFRAFIAAFFFSSSVKTFFLRGRPTGPFGFSFFTIFFFVAIFFTGFFTGFLATAFFGFTFWVVVVLGLGAPLVAVA